MAPCSSSSSSAPSIEDFCATQAKLLQYERHVELYGTEQPLHTTSTSHQPATANFSSSSALHQLVVSDISVGLYGRTVLTLEPASTSSSGEEYDESNSESKLQNNANAAAKKSELKLLPAHTLTTGNDVEVMPTSKSIIRRNPASSSSSDGAGESSSSWRGVVCQVTDSSLSVALSGKRGGGLQSNNEKDQEEESLWQELQQNPSNYTNQNPRKWSVVSQSSGEVQRRLHQTLDKLQKASLDGSHVATKIIEKMFRPERGGLSTISEDHGKEGNFAFFNPDLDESQKEAVQFALKSEDLALIHGPPGTGKTTTIVEVIQQAVFHHQWKVLVCAPSNVAVDNILQRLVAPPSPPSQPQSKQARQKQKQNKKLQNKIRAVRLGHPARVQSTLLQHSLEALVKNADGTEVVRDAREELQGYIQLLTNYQETKKQLKNNSCNNNKNKTRGQQATRGGSKKSKGPSYSDRQKAKQEIRILRKEIKQREQAVVAQLLQEAHVILSTNVGAATTLLDKNHSSSRSSGKQDEGMEFDLVVIDEAAQATEVSCWIPLLRGKRAILAGDHWQLPPTVLSRQASQGGLSDTLFQRAIKLHGGEKVAKMLTMQYRMHERICRWSSEALYEGRVESAEGVKRRTLGELVGVREQSGKLKIGGEEEADDSESENVARSKVAKEKDNQEEKDDEDDDIKASLLLIDSAGCDNMEEETTESGSKYNRGEAEIVKLHVEKLLSIGLQPTDLAIISPYNGQVQVLRHLLLPLHPKLEIRSVDGFQGGEREAVVLSLVRSNEGPRRSGGKKNQSALSSVGFLADERRMNVAVTRAKRHVAIVCNSETVGRDAFLQGLVGYVEERGLYKSAALYMNDEVEVATMEDVLGVKKKYESGVEQKNDADVGSSAKQSKEPFAKSKRAALKNTSSAQQANAPKKVQEQASEERKEEIRSQWRGKVQAFAAAADSETQARHQEKDMATTTMEFSENLSSLERLILHELAEEYGLQHVSENVEVEVNGAIETRRRLVLSRVLPKDTISEDSKARKDTKDEDKSPNEDAEVDVIDSKESNQKDIAVDHSPSVFSAMGTSSSSSSSSEDEDSGHKEHSKKPAPVNHNNNLLGDLAKARIDRQNQAQLEKLQQRTPQQQPQKGSTKSKKNKKKKNGSAKGNSSGGHKLGGAKMQKKPSINDYDNTADLDDMAFLTAEAAKVQSSHGVKLSAPGPKYRTIVNGILNERPKTPPKKRNERASRLLQEKLRQSEDDRGGNKNKKKGSSGGGGGGNRRGRR